MKKISKKIVESSKTRRGKSVGKKKHSIIRKAVSSTVKDKTSSDRVKSSIKPQQSKAKSNKTAAARHGGGGGPSATATPKRISPQLQELERGKRYKQLHEKGVSFGLIAKKFGCSKTLARDLVELASLPNDLEEAYLQGKTGRKAVLELARKRRHLETELKTKERIPVIGPQNNLISNPKPVVAEANRQAKIAELVTIILSWVRSLNLTPYDLESFWNQVNTAFYRGCHRLFTDEAPKPDEIKHGANPWKMIERCKVDSKNANSMPDVINNHVTWLARWIQRVTQDWAIIKEALAQAKTQLRQEAQTTCWY